MSAYEEISVGDPAPWFRQRTFSNPRYAFDTAAGRYLVLCFYGSAGDPQAAAAIEAASRRTDLFDDRRASFFGVSVDPADEREGRVADRMPGHRHMLDFDGLAGRLYGALPREAGNGPVVVRRRWVVLDPSLRVIKVTPFREDGGDVAEVLAFVEALPPVDSFAGFEVQAPILVLPNVLEPEFCAALIDVYERHGGTDSGFMREVDGRTVEVQDHRHKRRRDCLIEDPALVAGLQARFRKRVIPMIHRAHQFRVTRMERYIVACYAAEDGAHFGAHRDNTTKGTAHRRFAVSVNLNDDFDGGEVRFPEFGSRSYKAPAGGAVVFSCSLLHAVSTVTRGRRYAFLPFLYDDEAARLREANTVHVDGEAGGYRDSAARAPVQASGSMTIS